LTDFSSLRKALAQLQEAVAFWKAQPDGHALKPHLRSAVIQSFEFVYELSIRMLRRVLMERAESADRVADLSFNELMRKGADVGLLEDPLAWRQWRELRNATSHTYDETLANEVATGATGFGPVATALLAALTLAGKRMLLSAAELRIVRQTLDAVVPGAEIWVFGSRAIGRARPHSDLDLLITRPTRLSWSERLALRDAFDEGDPPFSADVVEASALAPGFAERVYRERLPL